MEYPDYVARFYNVVYSQLRTADHDFYLEKIAETRGPVLEIGVGTGRFFLEALASGTDAYGIDASDTMLNILKQRLAPDQHFRVSNQRIEEFSLDKTFDLILSPFRVFSHLVTIDSQLAALERIRGHLNEKGVFIFDLFVPNLQMIVDGLSERIDFDGEYEERKKLRRITSVHSDFIEQVNHVSMRYEWEEGGKMNSETWNFPMRYYFRWELEHLVARSGLKLEAIYGDFSEGPLTNESKEFIVVCSKV